MKHSLFNLFKMLRPVVLDEAHKAYGSRTASANQEFVRSVNRLTPAWSSSFPPTPQRRHQQPAGGHWRPELKNEQMIKLPVQVSSFRNTEWQHTLAQAHDELNGWRPTRRPCSITAGAISGPLP